MSLRADLRAAAATLMRGYVVAAGLKTVVYPARPKLVQPNHAFVDLMTEQVAYFGPTARQRKLRCDMIVVHRIFDGQDAADQADAFVDGFLDYCLTRPHAANGNSVVGITAIEDIPNWAPDWYQTSDVFFATRISMEGNG